MLPDRMTAKQYADTIIIASLETMYRQIERTNSYDGQDLSPGEARKVMGAVAKRHNAILASSSL